MNKKKKWVEPGLTNSCVELKMEWKSF
jgi:hypothetical protein